MLENFASLRSAKFFLEVKPQCCGTSGSFVALSAAFRFVGLRPCFPTRPLYFGHKIASM
jgi:hypothetical protein